jgi:ferredoxin
MEDREKRAMPRLLSVNVGLPRDVAWRGKTVHTGIWKTPVQGRRVVRRLNIDGDGQGDLAGHGGEHRAVFVYQIDSYRYWQAQLGRNDFSYGQFSANRIHIEIFGSSPPKTPGIAAAPRRPPHQPAGSAGVGPLVSFARSGLDVRWAPAFQSLLELAEACDVPVRWACRTGVCHTCETGLINGAVGYRPEPVEPPADGNALICCCRPQGDIVVDL